MTTNEEIKEILVAHGATTGQDFVRNWLAAHATASMSAFCRDLQIACRATKLVDAFPVRHLAQ